MNNKCVYLGNFELREATEDGIIEGRAIVFNEWANIGWYDEMIAPEALAEADLRDVRLCLNHDTSFVYARSRNNTENSTMQLYVKEDGVYVRAKLDIENSPRAQSYHSAVTRKDIDKMSFMFVVSRDEWQDIDTDHPKRIIRGIERVLEVSAVTFPAYPQTSIQARGLSDALESAMESLENERTAKRELEIKKQRIRLLTEV